MSQDTKNAILFFVLCWAIGIPVLFLMSRFATPQDADPIKNNTIRPDEVQRIEQRRAK